MSLEHNRRDPRLTLATMTKLAKELRRRAWRRSVRIGRMRRGDLPPGRPDTTQLAPPAEMTLSPVSAPVGWAGPDRYHWLVLEVDVPSDWPADGGPLLLRGTLGGTGWNARNPQGVVAIAGRPIGGIDTHHHEVRLPGPVRPGEPIRLDILLWTGMEDAPGACPGFELAQLDEQAESLALEFEAAVNAADSLDEEDHYRFALLSACRRASERMDLSPPPSEGFYATVGQALSTLREAMAKIDRPADRPTASLIGHGHLDLGWLWSVEASHFKTLHTVVNQINLSDEFPEHIFLWSQPQSWQWLQHDHPDTWRRLCEKVASGNWEAQGAMWCECDTNITGGESLVRQLLYGTRFLREHLGQEETLLWLPDVFGFSAALPQLLCQFGIRFFMTTKLSWNEYNRFSHDTFFWRGLGEQQVLVHLGAGRNRPGPYITYNTLLSPQALAMSWRDVQSKDVTDQFLISFGVGDGGGGPNRYDVQQALAMADLPGLPRAKFQSPRALFEQFETVSRETAVPVWRGELYLEYHRGTYTTEARTKRGNRRCETALHDAELLASLALPLGVAWDKDTLDACWQRLLLNQFHDILPGSSIAQVYEQAERDYAWIAGLADEVRDRAAVALVSRIDTAAANRPLVVFNTAGHDRSDVVELPADLADAPAGLRFAAGEHVALQAGSDPDGRGYLLAEAAHVPACGWAVADVVEAGPADSPPLTVSERGLENQFWRVELDGAGRIARLFDKRANRDVLRPARASAEAPASTATPIVPDLAPGNQLQLFRDRPINFEAWDVQYGDTLCPLGVLAAERVEVVETGPVRAAVRCHYRFGDSRLVQDIRLYSRCERIDFASWVDWHERDLLLKAAFAVDVDSPQASFEVQFGTVQRPTHRNTSWDVARFETPAQRWIDLSEHGYGVSLLNDCKYGHDVLDNVLRVSLLRGQPHSRDNMLSDQGEHRFTYSLLPHTGGWQSATVEAAIELNQPLRAASTDRHAGELPDRLSLVRGDRPGFVISTVKKAEDDDRLIVRGYESHGGRGRVRLSFGRPVRNVWRSRADERVEQPLAVADDAVSVEVDPFEVVTLKVEL